MLNIAKPYANRNAYCSKSCQRIPSAILHISLLIDAMKHQAIDLLNQMKKLVLDRSLTKWGCFYNPVYLEWKEPRKINRFRWYDGDSIQLKKSSNELYVFSSSHCKCQLQGTKAGFQSIRCQIVVVKNFLLLFNNWTLHLSTCWNQTLFWLCSFFHIIFQFENEIQGIQSDVSDLNKQQVRIIYLLFCWLFLQKPL